MDVLVVSPHLPYEGVPHAGGEYLLRHLQELSRHGRVTLLVPASPETLAAQHRAPDWLDLVVAPIDLAGRSTGRRLADAAYRRLRAAPPQPTAESLRALRAAGLVRRAEGADVVELHWPEYARLARELREAGVRTPLSVVEHDVHVDRVVRDFRGLAPGYRGVVGTVTSPLAWRAERDGLRASDVVLVFKAPDVESLRRAGVTAPVRVLDPWLHVPTGPPPVRTPGTVLFTGAMWRAENDDGARWLVTSVWPQVLQAVPDARLTIAGSGPSDGLRALAAATTGVEITGEVPDLLPLYGTASVFAAPLFTEGGLKFKVAQAMLCGLPVVGTRTAVAGIAGLAPAEALWGVGDDPDAFAARLVDALRQPEQAAASGQAAAAWAAGHWSFARSVGAVLEDYRRLASGA